jgi:hypothetical protein
VGGLGELFELRRGQAGKQVDAPQQVSDTHARSGGGNARPPPPALRSLSDDRLVHGARMGVQRVTHPGIAYT